MARYLYGGTAADVTTTQAGRLVTGATLTVWDSDTVRLSAYNGAAAARSTVESRMSVTRSA